MWLIIRTDHAKEAYVARQLILMGYDAWVPAQVIVARPHVARRVTSAKALQKIRELPLLPRRLFATVPLWVQDELRAVRHCLGFETDAALLPIQIPPPQIMAFKAEIDRENTASLALATRQSRKQKAKWRSLHDALLEMIQDAKQQLEQAA